MIIEALIAHLHNRFPNLEFTKASLTNYDCVAARFDRKRMWFALEGQCIEVYDQRDTKDDSFRLRRIAIIDLTDPSSINTLEKLIAAQLEIARLMEEGLERVRRRYGTPQPEKQ